MKPNQLLGYLQTHRGAALGVGAAGTAGAALILRRRSAGKATSSTGSAAMTSTTRGTTGSTGGVQGSYDSSSYDTYNSLEPILEQLGGQVSGLSTQLGNVQSALDPANNPTAPVVGSGGGGGGAVGTGSAPTSSSGGTSGGAPKPATAGLSNAQAYAQLAKTYNHPVDAAWLQSQFGHPVSNAWLNGIVKNPPKLPGKKK